MEVVAEAGVAAEGEEVVVVEAGAVVEELPLRLLHHHHREAAGAVVAHRHRLLQRVPRAEPMAVERPHTQT